MCINFFHQLRLMRPTTSRWILRTRSTSRNAAIPSTCVVVAALWLLLLNNQRQAIKDIAAQTTNSRDRVTRGGLAIAATEQVETDLAQEIKKLQAREDLMASGDMYSWIIQTVNLFKSR